MKPRILIVEDEVLIAMEMEYTIDDLVFETVGIASDAKTAIQLAEAKSDIALVNLNLRDGFTGIEIGAKLSAEYGVTVVFITANPRLLGNGVAGTLGEIEKPFNDSTMSSVELPNCMRALAA